MSKPRKNLIKQTKVLYFENEIYFSRDDINRFLSEAVNNRKGEKKEAFFEVCNLLTHTFLNSAPMISVKVERIDDQATH